MWQQKQQKLTEENKLVHVQREDVGQTCDVKFDLPHIPTSGIPPLVLLGPFPSTTSPIICFLIRAPAIIHVFPSIIHLSHPHPLPLLFHFSLKVLSLLTWIHLLTWSIVFTPVRLHVPLSSQNDSCQECQDLPISNPVMTPQFLPYSSCWQECIQWLLPSSLKLFSSLSFLDATLGTLPTRKLVFANLLCWFLLAPPQPVHIQVPWSSYHFSICPPSQSKINLLALNIT